MVKRYSEFRDLREKLDLPPPSLQNVVCPLHKNSENIGDFLIISLGDYTECKLVIKDKEYNAKEVTDEAGNTWLEVSDISKYAIISANLFSLRLFVVIIISFVKFIYINLIVLK